MTDDDLSNLLKEWKRTPAPPSLNARVLGSLTLPPSHWWDRIPASLTTAAGAVAGGLAVWVLITLAARTAPQVSVEQSKPPVTPAEVSEPVAKENKPPAVKPAKPVQAKKPVKAPPAENLTTASPRLLSGPVPVYPADAPLLKSPITLKLRIRIGTDGRVIDAEVIDGDPLLSSIALEAVKAWLYEPGAETTTEVDVVFEPRKKK